MLIIKTTKDKDEAYTERRKSLRRNSEVKS